MVDEVIVDAGNNAAGAAPGETPAAAETGSSDLWSDVLTEVEGLDVVGEGEVALDLSGMTPGKEEGSGAPAPAAVEPPAPTPAAPGSPAADIQTEVVVAAPEAPAVQQPAPEPPPQPGVQPEQLSQMREEWIGTLASRYQFDEATKEKLLDNPAEVLPQLAARVVADAVETALQSVTQIMRTQLPVMIQQTTQFTTEAEKNESLFYTQWGELNKPELKDTVLAVAREYRAMHPQATAEQFLKEVGPLAWVRAGLPVEALVAKMANVGRGVVPATPAAPAAPASYAPARPGTATPVVPAAPHNDNIFAIMAEEFLNEG